MRLLAKNPVKTIVLDMSVTNITLAAWVQIISALGVACTAVEIFNESNSLLALSQGPAGQEAAHVIPYTLIPGNSILIPLEFNRNARLSAIALDTTANVGRLVMNFFG